MRYGSRLKLYILMQHLLPGERSLPSALSWDLKLHIGLIENYRKAGTIYSLGHTGILLKLVSLNYPHLTRQTIIAVLPRILAGDYQTNIKI